MPEVAVRGQSCLLLWVTGYSSPVYTARFDLGAMQKVGTVGSQDTRGANSDISERTTVSDYSSVSHLTVGASVPSTCAIPVSFQA